MDSNSFLHKESLKSINDKVKVYDQWADTYEDYVKELNYEGPNNLAKEVIDFYADCEKDHLKILDFGCGTGLVGLELAKVFSGKFSFTLDGIDISERMIQHSREKNIYTRIWCLDLYREVLPQQYQYDLIVSSGVFLEGHVGFKMIDTLLNSLEPFGIMFFTVRETFRQKYKNDYIKYVVDNPRTEILHDVWIPYLPNIKSKMVVLKKLF
jgi:predicted TPR repeat methyltransferase